MALRDNDWYANDALTSADLSRIVLESIDESQLAWVLDPFAFDPENILAGVLDADMLDARRVSARAKARSVKWWLNRSEP